MIDAEMRRICDRVMRGVGVDEEHMMYEVISRVGPGGHYLSTKETRRYLRAGEHLSPKIFVREASQ